MFLAPTRGNPFQRRRVASQTKPIQDCHPERSEGSLFGERSFAALRMTKRDGLFFEMYWGLCMTLRHTLYWLMLMDEGKRAGQMRSTWVYRKDFIYDR